MKTPAKKQCKSCELGYLVNSSIKHCIGLDCKGTRELMRKMDEKRKKRPFFTTYEPKFYLNEEGGKRE